MTQAFRDSRIFSRRRTKRQKYKQALHIRPCRWQAFRPDMTPACSEPCSHTSLPNSTFPRRRMYSCRYMTCPHRFVHRSASPPDRCWGYRDQYIRRLRLPPGLPDIYSLRNRAHTPCMIRPSTVVRRGTRLRHRGRRTCLIGRRNRVFCSLCPRGIHV